MPKLIKNGELVDNTWTLLNNAEDVAQTDLSKGNWIIPSNDYIALAASNSASLANCAPWLATDFDSNNLDPTLLKATLICIHFPAFTDGRGFSLARTIREHHDFQGDLRASGHFIADQIFFLSRCGISSFAISDEINVETAVGCLNDFSIKYQAAIDEPQPLFRRRN